jgi:hypothetical protein
MSASLNTNAPLRKMISVLLIVGLLAFLLVLYFLKYVPDQRSDFHRRAFLELSQIEKAVQARNKAFIEVIRNSVDSMPADSIGNSLLNEKNYFHFEKYKDYEKIRQITRRLLQRSVNPKATDTLVFRKVSFRQGSPLGIWTLSYQLSEKDTSAPIAGLNKNVDSLLSPLVSTYKDIFSDYLLILDTTTTLPEEPGPSNEYNHKGRVIFNSGHLSVDFLVNMDTLLKKTDGFSLLNIHDVKIEGNPYKLFLYPIQLCNQRVILGGLISQTSYKEGSESVPVDLLTIGSILLLLLLLNLPLLKIYIIGPMERITSLDIRMIIITYFVAAFVIFFLFASFFLSQMQARSSWSGLHELSAKIQDSFYSEIGRMNTQLKTYDTLYANLHLKNTGPDRYSFTKPIDSLSPLPNLTTAADRSIDKTVNDTFHPSSYPQLDLVFWIDSSGNWVGRWGFKKTHRRSRRLNVADRQYFKDVMNGDLLSLPGDPDAKFAIQPTLSRVTGEYNINLVTRSNFDSIRKAVVRTGAYPSPGSASTPAMLGIAADMYSLQKTILPPGYTFSIVDNAGDIKFDARPGRALLSNIFTEAGDNTDIQQCVRFRYNRYFDKFSLRGREVALLSKPIPNTDYTLLVYYNLFALEEFRFHSLGLSCFCMALILLLIAIIAFMNEWAKKRPSLLDISAVNFDWLRPSPVKMAYYKHLFLWMSWLFGLFISAWFFIDFVLPDSEPALLLISLSFPFFIAIHYYVIREKYYHLLRDPYFAQRKRPLLSHGKPFLRVPALQFLGLILVINFVYLFSAGLQTGVLWSTLLVQLGFLSLILASSHRLRKLEQSNNLKVLIRRYVAAILMGVFLITLVPATGIFLLIYKEENNSRIRMELLNMAGKIKDRTHILDKRKQEYDLREKDSGFLTDSKFKYGIYFADRAAISFKGPETYPYTSFTGYGALHNFLFPTDSSSLEAMARNDKAGDSSWHFDISRRTDRLFLSYQNHQAFDKKETIYLSADPHSQYPALKLFIEKLFSIDALPLSLAALALPLMALIAWCLTGSLASHVFLLQLLRKYKQHTHRPRTGEPCDLILEPGEPLRSLPCKQYILTFENPFHPGPRYNEKEILQTQVQLEKLYDSLWTKITTEEKYILYDFSLDGFTNYKAGVLIYKLLYRDLLRIDDNYQLHIRSLDFYNYLLSKNIFNQYLIDTNDLEVYRYMSNVRKQGSWQTFRIPLQIIFAVLGLFVFFTQEALYQRVIGLFTSLPVITQLLASFFEKTNSQDENRPAPGKDQQAPAKDPASPDKSQPPSL